MSDVTTHLLREDRSVPVEPLASETEALPDPLLTFLQIDTGQCFAVLDAAAFPLLPELIDAHAEDAACLWQGNAARDMAHLAPWLIRLSSASRLTRSLFAGAPDANVPWQLWGAWPGLILRARADVTAEALRSHLRKMTRLRDAAGQWYFLRFWEVATARAFWGAFATEPDEVAWRYGSVIEAVVFPDGDRLTTLTCEAALPDRAPPGGVIDRYRPLFRDACWRAFQMRVLSALRLEPPPLGDTPAPVATALCDEARAAGYQSEAAIWDVVRAALLTRATGRTLGDLLDRGPLPDDNLAAARQLLLRARAGTSPEI
ncbi:DUF4123 domain-containing protein [Jannaschia pohangensis]|uniref:DUF4123 domain-containing protein n=1 Tax=Jannaschia pohangensis TaxID=390807 RepID=A0A1I3IGL7_9RHOB|nr:DUF4123 domain-containing protein [Jannaschia pohangensis]SFI47071.1 protein of unknown function [Jannaschia pohangensis]